MSEDVNICMRFPQKIAHIVIAHNVAASKVASSHVGIIASLWFVPAFIAFKCCHHFTTKPLGNQDLDIGKKQTKQAVIKIWLFDFTVFPFNSIFPYLSFTQNPETGFYTVSRHSLTVFLFATFPLFSPQM